MKKPHKPKQKRTKGRKRDPRPASARQASRAGGKIAKSYAKSKPNGRPGGPAAMSRTAVYSTDDRQVLMLLFLPVILMAFAIGMQQSFKPFAKFGGQIATMPPPKALEALSLRTRLATAIAQRPMTPVASREAPALPASAAAPPQAASDAYDLPRVGVHDLEVNPAGASKTLAVAAAGTSPPPEASRSAAWVAPATSAPAPAPLSPAAGLAEAARAAKVMTLALLTPAHELPLAREPPAVTAAPITHVPALTDVAPSERIAAIAPDTEPEPPRFALPPPVLPAPVAEARPEPGQAPLANVCVSGRGAGGAMRASLAQAAGALSTTAPGVPTPQADADFGSRLATAAQTQLDDLVVYTDRYRHISYPMGDLPAFFGVCTDVVIRAYRAVGLDLQELVHRTRVGSGDPSIDHRRTETLRRFFATYGQSIDVTDFAEDYRPGDIVTYWRPQNRHSTSHIAIVATITAPSGRPMIIHNRGYGPQIEDGLFVDQITGHYRFDGSKIGRDPAAVAVAAAGGPTRNPGPAAASQSAKPQAPKVREARSQTSRQSAVMRAQRRG